MDYATVVHSCLCGCGQRVVTPLTPTDWHVAYDGDTVSLSRSIGNWSFPCRSHYWIEHSRVHWAGGWSKDKIKANRAADLELKRRFYKAARGSRFSTSPTRGGSIGRTRPPPVGGAGCAHGYHDGERPRHGQLITRTGPGFPY